MKKVNIMMFLMFSEISCGGINPFKAVSVRNPYNGKSWKVAYVFEDSGARALALAGARGNTKEIQKLHRKGVNVNYRGKEGITPLLWALYARNKAGFEELLKLGADPNKTTDEGSGAMSIMNYAANDKNDTDFLELALKYGGNPNFVNNIGWPLIHNVCDYGPFKRLELVLAAGADLNSKDDNGKTPIMFCAVQLQYDKVLYLLERGAKYSNDIVNSQGVNFKKYVEDCRPSANIKEEYDAYQKVVEFLAKRGIKIKTK